MRNKVIGGILAVGIVATMGTTMAVAARNGGTPPKLNGPAMHAVNTATDALPGGQWTAIPPAPIVGRSDAVGIWTGSQMFVWGGRNTANSRDYADGATYDPTTRRWTMVPAAPLSGRSGAAAVWTGHVVFVWGGTDARDHIDTDGALYDPATRRWTKLPTAPVSAHSSVQALWTGTKVLLLSMPPGRTSDHVTLLAFDPSSRRWAVLPTLHLRAEHKGYFVTGVVAGNTLMLWSHWSYVRKVRGGFEGTSGIDGYTLDLHRMTWALNAFKSPSNDTVDTALWTGSQVLVPASQLWCGYCPGPFSSDSKGLRVDPQTLSVHTIPHGPADDLGASYLWTGSVLLAVNTVSSASGPQGPIINPGRAAYWRPSTNTWTRLPSAPLAGSDAVTVWTGHILIVWGVLYPDDSPGSVRSHTAGLQLSR